jgi:hypothetical protein
MAAFEVTRLRTLRFALEAGEALGIEGEKVRQDLEGDLTIQRAVVRAVDLAHATPTERGENPIMPDLSSFQRRIVIEDHPGTVRCEFPGW